MLMLSYLANELPHNRYGFVTSKRLGKAVRRNRIRRLIREAVRLQHPQLKQGFDCIFIARPAIIGQPFSEVQRIVYELCRRAGLEMKDFDV
jgi:ribonuclease P protein component